MSLRRRAVAHLTFDEETVRDAILDLVRVSDQIAFVDQRGAVEIINALDAPVFDERLDHVFEPWRPVSVAEDSGQGGSSQIQIEVGVISEQVLPHNLFLNRIEAVAVKSRTHADARRQREARERLQREGQARRKIEAFN